MGNYHDQLGVSPDASEKEIRKAYRKLAAKYHPDVNDNPDATEKFIRITEAYDTLLHPQPVASSDTHQGGHYSSPDYHAARRARAKAYAEMSFKKFREENDAFRNSWYYFPVKAGTTLLVYIIYFFGFSLVAGSVTFFILYPGMPAFIGAAFLAGLGVRVFISGKQIEREARQYFPDEQQHE